MSLGNSLKNSVFLSKISLISSTSKIVTGEPESTIAVNELPFLRPVIVNCPFSSLVIVSTILLSSSATDSLSLLLSSYSSMRCILCGALATFRFLAKLHAHLVWQHLAKRLFFQLFMQVIPMALHSFRCWGVNIPSRLKHFFGGPHLLCFRFTAFRNFNLVAFLIGRRTAAGCLHSEYDKKDVQQKSSSEPKIQWQKISSSQTRTKKGTRLRTGYFLPLFFGSVLDFCCTSLFVIFTMKTSFTRL